MPTVRVKGLEAPLEVEEGEDLLSACRKERVNLFWGPWARLLNCRGVGLCTLCKVDITDGADNLSSRTPREEKRLRWKPDHWRLACQAKVQGPVSIDPYPLVPVEEQVSEEALRRARLPAAERRRVEAEAEEHLRGLTALTEKAPKEKKSLLDRLKPKKEEGEAEEKDKKKADKRRKKEEAAAAKEAKGKKKAKKPRKGKKGKVDEEETVEA
ncbi:MAG: 2Fe-2S iron-sulfur cluster binding domain-containing protein [Euryarchaeota archaeon]|nr:2Fe-2S iron-sulfur cluster binding domain-containing protein [Euryarchaeota archaeon]